MDRLHLKFSLWWQFTVRAVEMRHRGSYLGFLWAVLNPLLMAALYVSVFGYVFNGRFHALPDETGMDYALGVFLGLVLFHLVTETLGAAPALIVGQPNLVKKVVFPLEVLPLAQAGALWFHALIGLVLFLVAAAALGRGVPAAGLLWLPVILLPHLLLTVGLGWGLAALGVFFRDVAQVVPLLAQMLLWSSAVFFSPAVIQKSALLWSVLKWNPVMHTLDLSRHAVLWNLPPNLAHLAYTWLAGAACFAAGAWVFRATKRSFAEVV
ncbi:MAG: ABC transporter permease [Gemmataceae bacterium]|nr:ABC transporter permease [Gemmataceae bacterium]